MDSIKRVRRGRSSRGEVAISENGKYAFFVAKVSSKGQITIPHEIREMLNATHMGDLIGFEKKGEDVVIKRVTISKEAEFTEGEWTKLKRLADEKSKIYTAKQFLRAVDKL